MNTINYEKSKSGLFVPVSFADRPESREVATTRDGRDITRGFVDPFRIQPSTDSILQLRGGGDYLVYKEVLRDSEVAACFAQRRLSVVGKEWQVEAGGTSRADKKAADLLREQLTALPFDRITDKMLYGIYYGFSAAEIMWGRDGANITLDDIRVRDRRRFGFDGFGKLRLKTFSNPDGEELPDRKFWSFNTGADHDDEPYGLGLAHWLYWPVFFKRAGIQYWMIFLERFGQPTTMGKHPANATQAEKNTLLNALEAIATDTGITVPQGMEIELLEAARSGTADYSTLCEYMDSTIAKITLGQTASTQGTPGRLGGDDLQGDVHEDRTRADADLVCESFNEGPVTWLTEYNFPGANPPRVYRVTDPEEDLKQRAERDKIICDMGFKPTAKYIKDQYGGEWEEKATSSLEQNNLPPGGKDPAQPAQDGAAFADANGTAPATLPDQLDNRLQSITDIWINRIKKLVMDAQSLDEIRDGLAVLLPDMDVNEYSAVMGEALRVAELNGRADILDEVTSAR